MKSKEMYLRPQISSLLIELEIGIAKDSNVSVGGSDGSGTPDIIDQKEEEDIFEINF